MTDKCGVYKITNTITNQSYIGSSKHINARWNIHKNRYKQKTNKEYNKDLYVAMRQYGIENFEMKILEECNPEIRLEREAYYIHKFNTIAEGYNGYGLNKHRNSKLTIDDIKNIRIRYNNLERKQDVYKDYCDLINPTGFNKIWNGYTWKDVMPEVFSEENKLFHKNNTSNKGEKNGTSKLTDDDVISIRTRKKNKEDKVKVYEDYKDLLTFRSFKNIWNGSNWKHIIV